MRLVVSLVLVVGCGPAVSVDDSATTDTSTSSSGTTIDSTTTSGVTTASTSSTTTVDDPTTGLLDESSDGGPFILLPDGGSCFTHCTECDLWSQDCAEGYKCAPWANDGGDEWNATSCRELDRSPAQPGDPCTISGDPASGIDDCDIASMCWDIDPRTGVGTCVPFCGGSEANPVCEGDTSCRIANNGALILCLPTCDPLAPACGDGLSCVADYESFFCVPSEHVEQEYAAPCDEWIGCGTGLVCLGDGPTPACDASCCTALCDLAAPECPDAGAGQSCVPYFEPGNEPAGLEDVGVCLIE